MGLQPVFALMHLGAQGHSIVYTALHLFPQDGGCLGRLGLRRFHDELIVEAPEAEAAKAASILREEMEGCVHYAVPLSTEVHEGKNWLEAH